MRRREALRVGHLAEEGGVAGPGLLSRSRAFVCTDLARQHSPMGRMNTGNAPSTTSHLTNRLTIERFCPSSAVEPDEPDPRRPCPVLERSRPAPACTAAV